MAKCYIKDPEPHNKSRLRKSFSSFLMAWFILMGVRYNKQFPMISLGAVSAQQLSGSSHKSLEWANDLAVSTQYQSIWLCISYRRLSPHEANVIHDAKIQKRLWTFCSLDWIFLGTWASALLCTCFCCLNCQKEPRPSGNPQPSLQSIWGTRNYKVIC